MARAYASSSANVSERTFVTDDDGDDDDDDDSSFDGRRCNLMSVSRVLAVESIDCRLMRMRKERMKKERREQRGERKRRELIEKRSFDNVFSSISTAKNEARTNEPSSSGAFASRYK